MQKKLIIIFVLGLLGLIGIVFYQKLTLEDGRLHVVFCDVGQGDAIFINTPDGSDILIDGGPDDKVLNCLSRHLPFWDRTLEAVILTHPHADHFNGTTSVIERYSVLYFGSEKLINDSAGFKKLIEQIDGKKIQARYLWAGDQVKTKDGVTVQIMAPTAQFLTMTSPGGQIGESGEFASLITLLTFGSFNLLLTGDSQIMELQEAIGSQPLSEIDVLQVPHHGSKTGLTADILDQLRPRLAVISVGKNNRYGHPTGEIIKLLADRGIRILRTDQNGEIEIISDGKGFRVW